MQSFLNGNEYTLLIVESPSIAEHLQSLVPQHIYVISTSGFLWMPRFDKKKLRLKRKAIPEKATLRADIRREARSATAIIIATDSDPAGDFIAWSLSEELKHTRLLRGNLTSLSSSSVNRLLQSAVDMNRTSLHKRLENRFVIREIWHRCRPGVSMKTAALSAIFGSKQDFRTFKSEKDIYYKSPKAVCCTYDSKFSSFYKDEREIYSPVSPLSTCRVLERALAENLFNSATDAQNKLNRLFETRDPFTGNGLITYPRTSARSFFPESWETIRRQWIQQKSLNDYIPASLQVQTSETEAHDAIRPVDINLSPGHISKHIHADLGRLYSLIHRHTMQAITLPEPVHHVFRSDSGNITVYSESKEPSVPQTLKPVIPFSELDHKLDNAGVLRPSKAGRYIEEAAKAGLIRCISSTEIGPGNRLTPFLSGAKQCKNDLSQLRKAADDLNMQPETIVGYLSS